MEREESKGVPFDCATFIDEISFKKPGTLRAQVFCHEGSRVDVKLVLKRRGNRVDLPFSTAKRSATHAAVALHFCVKLSAGHKK